MSGSDKGHALPVLRAGLRDPEAGVGAGGDDDQLTEHGSTHDGVGSSAEGVGNTGSSHRGDVRQGDVFKPGSLCTDCLRDGSRAKPEKADEMRPFNAGQLETPSFEVRCQTPEDISVERDVEHPAPPRIGDRTATERSDARTG